MVRGAVRGDFSGDACNIVAKIVTLPSQISEGLAERPSRPGSTHHKRSERTMPSKKRAPLLYVGSGINRVTKIQSASNACEYTVP